VAPNTVVNLEVASLGDNPTTIPDLIRRSREDAESEIRQLGLNFRRPQMEESDEREGTVIRQKPEAGRQYGKGCPVNVEVTVAVAWVIVGNYEGLQLDEARQRIRSIDLTESVSYRPTTDYRVGTVLSQSPSPGSKARHRSTVSLTVATTPIQQPPPPTEPRMPSVIGQEVGSAKSYLEQLGFKVTLECHDVSEYPNKKVGTVVAQSPAADTAIGNKPPVTLKYVVNSCVIIN
jgi:serine/threonine-protein kinase